MKFGDDALEFDAVDDYVKIARAAGLDLSRMRFDLRRLAHESLREHGCTMTDAQMDAILSKDIELNAAGLAAWLKREAN